MIAFSRPFWPLFLHVLGAMTLFGAVLTAEGMAIDHHGRLAIVNPMYELK